jgi:hypothetical protein
MGGIVDPKTGEIIWDMRVPVVDQVRHYGAHPPRAIAAMRCSPIDVDWKFDGHGEPVNTVFELACPCGGVLFTATCNVDTDEEVCSPIAIRCDACAESRVIFDIGEHGYDAEVNHDEGDDGEGPYDLETVAVDEPFEVVVRFEYPSDHLGDPEWSGREHDLFSWFTLLARDPETKQLEHLYEFECA